MSHVNCTIQNFSAKGARLELPVLGKIPDRFDLIIDRDSAVLHCRVKWRDDSSQTIGVEFERRPGEHAVTAAASKVH